MFITPTQSPKQQARTKFLMWVQTEAEKAGPIGSVAYIKEAKRLIQGGKARTGQRLPLKVEATGNRRIVTVGR